MKTLLILGSCIFTTLAFSQPSFKNILIDSIASPNEVSIALDFSNNAHLMAGSNLNNLYLSGDTGKTWTTHKLRSKYEVYGDPCVVSDYLGNFYYFHLSNYKKGTWIDRIVCQKSSDKGITWNTDTYTGKNGIKVQDKHWAAIDPKSNAVYVSWTQFDKYDSKLKTDSSIILFSKSEDEGKTWSAPTRLSKFAGDCLDDDNTVEGAVPCVGINGEIHVAWAGPKGLVFNQSKDGGTTWLKEERVVSEISGGWVYQIDSIFRCNGLPIIACDRSASAYKGTIYINWSDQRNGENDTDIWLVKSTDNGITWSEPKRVNNDEGKAQQFMSWLTIDQSNGRLYCLFYDRRDFDDARTDVYLAYSDNGGETFTNLKVNEWSFLPSKDVFFGDYINIVAHHNIVRPIWMSMHNNKLAIWSALINGADLK